MAPLLHRQATAWLFLLSALAGAAAVADPLGCSTLPAGTESPPPPDFTGPLQHVTIGSHRIAYRRVLALVQESGAASAACAGAGTPSPPLVLLLGYGCTMSQWGTRLLRRLAQQRELILVDHPAQGLSEDLEGGASPMTMPVLSELTLGFLKALGLHKPHLAGFSLGGCIALKLAAEHPEAVGKVVTFGANSMDGRAVLGSPEELGALFTPTNDMPQYAPFFFNTSAEAGRLAACRWIADAAAMPEDKPKPEANQRYAAGIIASVDPQNTAIWDALPRITAPVLLMGGLEDVVVPARAQPELAARIPGTRQAPAVVVWRYLRLTAGARAPPSCCLVAAPSAWLALFPAAGHAFFSQLVEPVAATMDVFLQHAGPAAGPGEAGLALEKAAAQVCDGSAAAAATT
ncbi:hypothetical protein ABPG75_009298 [Micractinium tetrahymenae]